MQSAPPAAKRREPAGKVGIFGHSQDGLSTGLRAGKDYFVGTSCKLCNRASE